MLFAFNDLSLKDLYDIMALRQAVFIVEQDCPYLDADGKDEGSYHYLLRDAETGELVAYCRLLPPFLAYSDRADVSIGRVVTAPAARGTGAGRRLMAEAIAALRELVKTDFVADKTNPPTQIRIGAQSYLLAFYGSFGFVSTGKEYLEDGIPHTEMVLGL